ncbi:hypothetical protein Tco_0251640 [Tanacetum coccineum]
MDDWDQLLDFNFDDIPLLGREGLPPLVCTMGKCNRNKKRAMENLNLFYQDIGTSSSTGRHLTQEEAAKEALAIRISQKFALLEEVRPVLETMAYHDKYKKVKGEALKEKDDPRAFIFPIRLEGRINENALADTGSDINTMPYRIYEQLGRVEMKKVDRGITMINHTQAEAMGILTNVLCQTMGGNDDEAGPSRSKRSRQFETVEEVLLPQVHHEFMLWEGCNRDAKSRLGLYHANELDEEGFDVYFQGGLRSDEHFNAQDFKGGAQNDHLWLVLENDWWMKRKGYGTQRESQICYGQFIKKIVRKARVLTDDVIRSMSTLIYFRDLDTTMLRELIDSEGRLILEDPQPGVPRVGIPRPPRASMQDLYDRMGSMEIRQEAIKRMSYRQSYHWDRHQGVFEHMAGFTVFHCREPTTHLDMHSHSMISIISSTHLRHRIINSSNQMRMMNSVEMTQEKKKRRARDEMACSKDLGKSIIIENFLELRLEQLQISHPSLWLCIFSFGVFSGALVSI